MAEKKVSSGAITMETSRTRPGKSKHTVKLSVTATEFDIWVKNYDSSGVYAEVYS